MQSVMLVLDAGMRGQLAETLSEKARRLRHRIRDDLVLHAEPSTFPWPSNIIACGRFASIGPRSRRSSVA